MLAIELFLTRGGIAQPPIQHQECGQQVCFHKISILSSLMEYHQMQLVLMVYTESQNIGLEAVHFSECSFLLLLISCIEAKTGSLTLSKIH